MGTELWQREKIQIWIEQLQAQYTGIRGKKASARQNQGITPYSAAERGRIQQPNSNSNIEQEININLNKAEAEDGVKRLGYGYTTADLRSEAQKGDSPSGKPI